MKKRTIRNIAIIAHVDHGKTTLVDQLLRQSGLFSQGELKGDCILDSNPLERERGITILSKNCAIDYKDRNGNSFHINIVDTPGHADFSGEVERVLSMADGVLLLVDAFEGVMPQTRYVLGKALDKGLRPIVVVNKMDRPDARPDDVVDEVLNLLIDLGVGDEALDVPIVYASGRSGWAVTDLDKVPESGSGDVHALFDVIIKNVPPPKFDPKANLQAQITSIDYSEYVGRIGIGRVFAGTLKATPELVCVGIDGDVRKERIGQLFCFDKLGRKEVDSVEAGDLFAVVGLSTVDIGETLATADHPVGMPSVTVDEPTLQMTFRINDGPFAGREGDFVTGRQVRNRLFRELQSNVALRLEERGEAFIVSGRGLLHLGILLENMRREGYELTVGKPEVIFHEEGGQKMEPVERLVVDVPIDCVGSVMQLVGERRGELDDMCAGETRTSCEFTIPARGLIGLRSKLLTATQGEVVMHHRFEGYSPFRGEVPKRAQGAMVATDSGTVTSYALLQLADRGVMFIKPGEEVYAGQIVGEHCRDVDINVNVVKKRHVTNIRAASKDTTVLLKAPRSITLEGALEYIEEDELVELTPKSIRLRKRTLSATVRRREEKKAKFG